MVSPLALRRRAAKASLATHSADLRDTLAAQRDRLAMVASDAKLEHLQKLYVRAQAELDSKLRAAIGAGRGDTFTAQQHRILLAQVRQGQFQIAKLMAGHAAELSEIAQVEALRGLEQDIARLEQMFTGAAVVIPTAEAGMFAGVVAGRRKSLLQQHQRSMTRWGQSTVDLIQDELAVSLATGETPHAAVDRVQKVANANFWQAERIVRTETAWAYNATLSDGIDKAADDLGDLYSRWVEFCSNEGQPLDARVGVDSIAMHGQLARPGESFTMPRSAPFPDAKGNTDVPIGLIGMSWVFPPNRPNDRAVIQPWRPDWGIPGWVYVGGQRNVWTKQALPPRERKPYEVKPPKPPPKPEPDAEQALPSDEPQPVVPQVARGEHDVNKWEMKYRADGYDGYAARQLALGTARREVGLDTPLRDVMSTFDDLGPYAEYHRDVAAAMVTAGEDASVTLRTVAAQWEKEGNHVGADSLNMLGALHAHVTSITPVPLVDVFVAEVKPPKPSLRDTADKLKNAARDNLHRLVDKSIAPRVWVRWKAGRASYMPGQAQITVAPNAQTELSRVFEHEYGHAIEDRHYDRLQAAKQFIRKRAGADHKVQMCKIRPNHGYRRDEWTNEDKFRDPYVGKFYSNATEVTSMGLQWLSDPYEMRKFYEADPEHFLFTLGQLAPRPP